MQILTSLFELDPQQGTPLHRQLYDALREAILSGRLVAGTRLPASRRLAAELQIARNTVLDAYDQLIAEGYIESRPGSGTYVSRALPEELLQIRAAQTEQPAPATQRHLSKRGALLAATPVTLWRDRTLAYSFRVGQPDTAQFPFGIWTRILQRHWRNATHASLGYGDPAGYGPLRAAIADYLGASRGVRCTADQVIVVSGSQQGLDLATRVLLDPGDQVWHEDPGYIGARGALISAGAQVVPVPIDQEGLAVEVGIERCPQARLAYITPSHQYPLGVTMSLARRLTLLEWAQRSGAWVLEDDYDGEYRYIGRPLPSLQGLDTEQRTVYLGTLSKTMFPALRLGYIVVPPDLVDAFVAAKALADRHAPTIEQAVLADFIAEGHFARHVRRMRQLYDTRRVTLIDTVQRELAGLVELGVAEAGMHVVGYLPESVDDRQVAQGAAKHQLDIAPLSAFAQRPLRRGGVLLGYAALDERTIQEGIRRLKTTLLGN